MKLWSRWRFVVFSDNSYKFFAPNWCWKCKHQSTNWDALYSSRAARLGKWSTQSNIETISRFYYGTLYWKERHHSEPHVSFNVSAREVLHIPVKDFNDHFFAWLSLFWESYSTALTYIFSTLMLFMRRAVK